MIKKKNNTEGKFTNDKEANACGWMFGVRNLGVFQDNVIKKIILDTIEDDEATPNWEQVYSRLQLHAMYLAESDSSWNNMLLEIKRWIAFAYNNDNWIVKEWKKYANKWGFKTSIQK